MFNNKLLPHFVSAVPDPFPWPVDVLSLSWKDLDPYAFPPVAILGIVIEIRNEVSRLLSSLYLLCYFPFKHILKFQDNCQLRYIQMYYTCPKCGLNGYTNDLLR